MGPSVVAGVRRGHTGTRAEYVRYRDRCEKRLQHRNQEAGRGHIMSSTTVELTKENFDQTVTYDASGAPSFAQQIANSTSIWNSSVSNVKL
ncbi:snapalysin family zinc-dependent metalloprotease, partial [Streptomyces sp. NPDC056690]|uniref:snapalysin family zinc-dependent metalloprotease n=1 Tax=Streptomyces sp. NPDC056690 TaxID=3345912 RepID=UPI00367E7E0E